ncbi:hypothetical protein KFL_004640070 [Klebsormidium nitens]|uniref:Phosphatidylethanolamine-binding protein n=1 Tax=Klebsormidium nitens TaxID=105231 RepID=A0A1Y1ID56_KLENI|nr:hypothetical protein KFL_004640070 [Klebsormidium nitens]|eukprot:GAQ88850.1 hypothetical protein KFL_004640070 [Klebsormidium nitens]
MSLLGHAAPLSRRFLQGRTTFFGELASSCGLSRTARVFNSSAQVLPDFLFEPRPKNDLCSFTAVTTSSISTSPRSPTARQSGSPLLHALNRARAFSGEPYQPALRHKRREHDVFDDVGVEMAVDFHELQAFRIFPDVLDEFQPMAELHVEYGEHRKVRHGAVLTPEWTQEPPKVRIPGGLDPDARFTMVKVPGGLDPDARFTLVMTDPDAPSPAEPRFAEFLHWMVANIPGTAATDGKPGRHPPPDLGGSYVYDRPPLWVIEKRLWQDISRSGDVLVPYMGPAPPTGLHRYVFVLFRQPRKLPREHVAPLQRPKFRTRHFAERYGLVPIGATFFSAEKGRRA